MAILSEMRDPRVSDVTVTHVEMAPDMREAKVYVSIMGDETKQNLAMRGLEKRVRIFAIEDRRTHRNPVYAPAAIRRGYGRQADRWKSPRSSIACCRKTNRPTQMADDPEADDIDAANPEAANSATSDPERGETDGAENHTTEEDSAGD